jgi:hypothetical protein
MQLKLYQHVITNTARRSSLRRAFLGCARVCVGKGGLHLDVTDRSLTEYVDFHENISTI